MLSRKGLEFLNDFLLLSQEEVSGLSYTTKLLEMKLQIVCNLIHSTNMLFTFYLDQHLTPI